MQKIKNKSVIIVCPENHFFVDFDHIVIGDKVLNEGTGEWRTIDMDDVDRFHGQSSVYNDLYFCRENDIERDQNRQEKIKKLENEINRLKSEPYFYAPYFKRGKCKGCDETNLLYSDGLCYNCKSNG